MALTSPMNCRTASSVCGLVGFAANEAVFCLAVDGLEVCGVVNAEYVVALGSGFISSMNLTLPPVRKQWIWLF